VFGIGSDSMVFLDKRIEDLSEIFVRIPVTGIDTTVLVVKLHSAGNSFGKGESRGLCLVGVKFVPFSLGYMLGDK